MFKDLREFLAKLEEEGQLVYYNDEVMPEPEVRLISRAACDMGSGTAPAVIMNNIKGYKGQRLAVNVHGSWANHALMFGMPKTTSLKDQFFELNRRWDNYPNGKVEWVDGDKAPCHEVILDEGKFNLLELLPCYKVNEYDGGFYLSKASVVSKDPDDPETLISELRVSEAEELMEQGYIGGGMLPKLQNCIDAIENGVSRVHILDGRIPHCLLLEIFTNKGIGTAILNDEEERFYSGE